MAFVDTVWHRLLRRPYILNYTETGEGEPVVLLHGIAASKAVWAPLAEEMSDKHWRILAPDLLGFGDSPKPQWNEYTVRDHARMVASFVRQQGVQGPVTFVGHSMGCLVATQIAVEHPRMVKRLILYEPPFLDESADEFPQHAKRSARYMAFFRYLTSHPHMANLENKVLWRIARRLSGFYLGPEEWVPFTRSLRNTILNQNAYKQLRDITVPTDIVYGRLDFIVIRQGIKDLFKHNKNVHLHLVTDVHGISIRSARFLASLLESTARDGSRES